MLAKTKAMPVVSTVETVKQQLQTTEKIRLDSTKKSSNTHRQTQDKDKMAVSLAGVFGGKTG